MEIADDNALVHVIGITNLKKLRGELEITESGALVDANGFVNLTSVTMDLCIDGNAALADLNGLSGLRFLMQNLKIEINGTLHEFYGVWNPRKGAQRREYRYEPEPRFHRRIRETKVCGRRFSYRGQR